MTKNINSWHQENPLTSENVQRILEENIESIVIESILALGDG